MDRATWCVVAPVHPLVSGGAQFNTAMAAALAELGPVETISWRRLYPPVLHRRDTHDLRSRPRETVPAAFTLDWADVRTWRRAVRRIDAVGARAIVLPWMHPVMGPPYRWLLRHAPRDVARVVICHNVLPHEPVPATRPLTRAVLRHADLLVTHAPHQREELARLGLGDTPCLEAFHPRFAAEGLGRLPTDAEVAAERRRQGDPGLLLLAFGAVRPYKGVDLALEALALLPRELDARLVVAGVFWDGGASQLREQARRLGVAERVELRDEFVSNEDAALLFRAADAAVLPYRSASQSGVVQLSFAYGTPVVATAVGGLPAAVRDGREGLLCPPEDPAALAGAIGELATRRAQLAAGVQAQADATSFARYARELHAAVGALRPARAVAAEPARPRTLEAIS